ncbi:MAG: ABC transporter permease [Firmicutes bacterium]|nr:ABC transporter permease [Candidatus Fermentithermobacillaceae bacterium]
MLRVHRLYHSFLKEWRQERRRKLSLISEIVLPLLFALPLVLMGLTFVGGTKSGFIQVVGTPYLLTYYAIGAILLDVSDTLYFGADGFVEDESMQGTLEIQLAAPSSFVEILMGYLLYSMVKRILAVFISLGTVFLIERPALSLDLAKLAGSLSLYVIYLAALGTLMAGFRLLSKGKTFPITIYGLVLTLSGYTYPVSVLPQPIRAISLVIPQTHFVDLIRSSVLGIPTVWSPVLQFLYVGVATAIVILLSAAGFVLLYRQAKREGTLPWY